MSSQIVEMSKANPRVVTRTSASWFGSHTLAVRQALLNTPDLAPRISCQVHDRTGSNTGKQQVANRRASPFLGSSGKVVCGCACGQRIPEEQRQALFFTIKFETSTATSTTTQGHGLLELRIAPRHYVCVYQARSCNIR